MSDTKKLFTFFFQFKDLTHVHQFEEFLIEDALKCWSEKIQTEAIDGADAFFNETISDEVEDRLLRQGLTKRNYLTNVWCCTFHFQDEAFGDLNITITENDQIEEQ